MKIPINKKVWSTILFLSLKKARKMNIVALKTNSMNHCQKVTAKITPSSLKYIRNAANCKLLEIIVNFSLPFPFLKNRIGDIILNRFSLRFHNHYNSAKEENFTEITADYDCNANRCLTCIHSKRSADHTVLTSTTRNATSNKIVNMTEDFSQKALVWSLWDWMIRQRPKTFRHLGRRQKWLDD